MFHPKPSPVKKYGRNEPEQIYNEPHGKHLQQMVYKKSLNPPPVTTCKSNPSTRGPVAVRNCLKNPPPPPCTEGRC